MVTTGSYYFSRACLMLFFALSLSACSSLNSKSTAGDRQSGIASYYHDSLHGNRTANGEVFNQQALTAAHRKLQFGTKVRVTNTANGKSVIVRINDRGPFVGGRIIDLSKAAFRRIGDTGLGLLQVEVEVL